VYILPKHEYVLVIRRQLVIRGDTFTCSTGLNQNNPKTSHNKRNNRRHKLCKKVVRCTNYTIWTTVHHTYLLCRTSHTEPHSRQQFSNYNIFYLSPFYHLTGIVTKTMIFDCGVIPIHCKCVWMLALTTLKMATWVTETCRWSLRNKITFIIPQCICCSLW